MNKQECVLAYEKIKSIVSERINTYTSADYTVSTLQKKFNTAFLLKNTSDYVQEESVKEKALKGDVASRNVIKDMISNIIIQLDIKIKDICSMIANYEINYFSNYRIIYKGDLETFKLKLSRLFISRDADNSAKVAKFVQMIYQDLYGLSLLDELLFDTPEKDTLDKIEEISVFGRKIWIQISGVKNSLTGMRLSQKTVQRIEQNLARNSISNLNEQTPQIKTKTMSGHRVSLRRPPLTELFSLNIRLHYDNKVSSLARRKSNSTSSKVERFLDIIVKFYPNLVVLGPQGTGKTTIQRDIYRRYPPNTVIGVTGSSSELGLDQFEHLIVENYQALPGRDFNTIIEDMLTSGLDMMVIEEVRNSFELETMIQIMLRQGFGSSCTFHAPNAQSGLFTMRTLLMRTQNYKSEREAMFELCRAVDFIISLGVDKKSGKRYIREICEIPSFDGDGSVDVDVIPIFKYNPKTEVVECVNPLSPELKATLLDRVQEPGAMKILENLCIPNQVGA